MRTKRPVDALAGLAMLAACSVFAQPSRLEDCAAISDDRERLHCYDRLAASRQAETAPGQAGPSPAASGPAQTGAPRDKDEDWSLAAHWELDAAHKRGTFNFRPHNKNYLLATYNPSPNDAPYRPFRSLVPGSTGLSRAEFAFQLGFKLKLAETPFKAPMDLWFGYTQRSFWQATNSGASSPFRETDYQPELMAVFPTDLNLLGLRMRFINLALVHQSNGQSSTLSRSWNRVYAQAGFERGNFTLLARVWKRFNEAAAEDDNPDIIDYLGRGDLVGRYRWHGQEFSLTARHNFHTGKGATQLGWTFPISARLQGYVQFFSGYGYTLVDYNAYQRVLGLGISIAY